MTSGPRNDGAVPVLLFALTSLLSDNVKPPKVHEFPVPDLLVEQGFRCELRDYSYLCASAKRMKSHWASKRGRPGKPDVDWSHVPLQTFFRGNLLRYFTKAPYENDKTSLGLENGQVGWKKFDCHLPLSQPPHQK